MANVTEVDELNAWDAYQEDVRVEYEQAQTSIKEISMMLDQSQAELNKLTQRNASVTAHLQTVQSQIETLPRADIRLAYDAAIDAQHRLFVMRGQLEKLQSDQLHLQKLIGLLEKTQQFSEVRRNQVVDQPVIKATSDNSLEMVINAQETEKQRLSRRMHDGPAQVLSNFILQTEIALRLFDIDQVRAREELTNLKTSAMTTFQKVRSFIFELRPMMLDDLGVFETITKYGESLKEQSGTEINIFVTGSKGKRLEPYLEVLVFRAFQELVDNAVHHSQGKQVKVIVNIEETTVKVSVEDNGKGFDPAILQTSSITGLHRVKDRVEMLGGIFDLDSVPGHGTRVGFTIPTEKAPDN